MENLLPKSQDKVTESINAMKRSAIRLTIGILILQSGYYLRDHITAIPQLLSWSNQANSIVASDMTADFLSAQPHDR